MLTQILPLEMLNPGDSACISAVDGSQEFVHRLAEMGLREGVEIRMVRSGRPCIVAVNNHRLSFRGDESASIFVEICGDRSAAETA